MTSQGRWAHLFLLLLCKGVQLALQELEPGRMHLPETFSAMLSLGSVEPLSHRLRWALLQESPLQVLSDPQAALLRPCWAG